MHTFSNNLLLSVTARALDVERALHANLVYRMRLDGTTQFVAVDREPSVDLSTNVLWITGLDDFVPRGSKDVTTGGDHHPDQYMAQDLRTAYLGNFGPCAGLEGSEQVVGIVSLEFFPLTDIYGVHSQTRDFLGYIGEQDDPYYRNDWPHPDLIPESVSIVNVSDPPASDDQNSAEPGETSLDVSMVLAMAPKARVKAFVGDTPDDILATMAEDSELTVASNSDPFTYSPNQGQSMAELALRGVTFFDASGDFGAQSNRYDDVNLPYTTVVGGTALTTTMVGVSSFPTDHWLYCFGQPSPAQSCFRQGGGEGTWNGGDVDGQQFGTGGGILNNSNCSCFPASNCCSGVVKPDWQYDDVVSPPDTGAPNGASLNWRNYPDVAAVATNVFFVNNGDRVVGAGTSISAPVWAGFAALVNQYSALHNANRLGFLNPTLYTIALTRGHSGRADLYRSSFHDIADGLTSTDTGGFRTVAGYDLTTGLGTPSCGLIQQVGTSHPLAPQAYDLMRLRLTAGQDGVDDDTPVYFYLLDRNGQMLVNQEIKLPGGSGWGQGTIHDKSISFDSPLSPYDVGAVEIHLGPSDSNWDISGLQVAFIDPQGPSACIADLSGGAHPLSDGGTGIVSIDQTHPDEEIQIEDAGCPTWQGPTSAGPLFDTLEFIIDTGDDDLDSDAELSFALIDSLTGTTRETGILHTGGSAVFADQSQWQVAYTLQNGSIGLGEIGSINFQLRSSATFGDVWHAQGVEVWAIDSTAPWERTCYAVAVGSPLFSLDSGGSSSRQVFPGGCTF